MNSKIHRTVNFHFHEKMCIQLFSPFHKKLVALKKLTILVFLEIYL